MRVKSPNFDNKTTIINCYSHSFLMRTHTILILSLFFLPASLFVPLFGSGRLAEREADTWSPNEISETHQQSEPMKTVNAKINQLILRSHGPHLFTAPTTKQSMLPDRIHTGLRSIFSSAHNNAIIRVTSTPFSVILIINFWPGTMRENQIFEINNNIAALL